MSLDAGGLAQMTYNNTFNGGIGLPTAGFASRGKATNVKRLSVTTTPKMGTIDETQPAQPRTSRSHLLAGLRTAPKSPSVPASAPPTQLQQPGGLSDSRFANSMRRNGQQETPKSATSGSFPNSFQTQYNTSRRSHMYTPSQVLAPPSIEIGDENGDFSMDPEVYDDLIRTNQYLAEQQLRLQQQLINVTAAAQQFQNLSLGQTQAQYGQNPMSPLSSVYNQQLQQGVQPIVEAVPDQPGLFLVYNPLTGQQSYFVDQSSQRQALNEQNYMSNFELSHSPPPPTPTFRAEVSPPPADIQSPTPANSWRTQTPPKISSSPPREEPTPLPPPSANAFRPSHRKNNLSLANTALSPASDAPKTGGLKSAGFPVTPLSGTFGPGQAREGQHPVRQPRGPPSLEELIAKPTSKFEGSKNFATRQRRRAVNNLVRAGIERRGARGTGSMDDLGSPTSEPEISFSVSSDNESVRSGSASLSGKPSLGSLRPSQVGAIGSERAVLKERSRERGSVDSYTASSVSSEDGASIGGRLMEVKAEPPREENKRKSTLAVLANAEKRRSLIY